MKLSLLALLLLAFVAACGQPSQPAQAVAPDGAGIVVSAAWARPTISVSVPGVVYLTITNNGSAEDRLTGASTPVAAMAELHNMSLEDGVMKMRALESITIPPGESVSLSPSGDHIMLMDVEKAFNAGDTFELTLSFEKAGTITTTVTVKEQ